MLDLFASRDIPSRSRCSSRNLHTRAKADRSSPIGSSGLENRRSSATEGVQKNGNQKNWLGPSGPHLTDRNNLGAPSSARSMRLSWAFALNANRFPSDSGRYASSQNPLS